MLNSKQMIFDRLEFPYLTDENFVNTSIDGS